MLRALVWKEWRQLRALRWAGLGLGVVLPVAFLAGSEAAKRGVLFSRVSENPESTIFLEVLPVTIALALWPLMALLLVSQAFAGDRATGVEAFLLDRPVPRSRTWLARLVASAGSTVVVAVATFAIAAILAFTQGPRAGEWAYLLQSLGAGTLVVLLAILGALAAASVVPSPMTALLLGLLTGAAPVGVALWLWSAFPAAAYRGLPLGLVVSPILPISFVAASWTASCRGEPSGRGRLVRFGSVLGATTALVLISFFSLAPAVVRLDSRRLEGGLSVASSPTGRGMLLFPHSSFAWYTSAWFVDPSRGRLGRFLPPPVESATISRDGRVAVVSRAGHFGSVRRDASLRFYGSDGNPRGPEVRLGDDVAWQRAIWAGSSVAVPVFRDRRTGVLLVDSESGKSRNPGFWRSWWRWSMIGPTADGKLFVALAPEEPDRPDSREKENMRSQTFVPYEVIGVDLSAGRLETKPLLHESGLPWRAAERLSPSGRYWLVDRSADRCETRPVLDLQSGKEMGPQLGRGRRFWLSGDILAWTETSGDDTWLLIARPGEDPKPVRGWRKASVGLEMSPDSALLMVEARAPVPDSESEPQRCPSFHAASLQGLSPSGALPDTRIYDPTTGDWIALGRWEAAEKTPSSWQRAWAGPRTLARTGPGYLALEDIDHPGTVRDVVGHAP